MAGIGPYMTRLLDDYKAFRGSGTSNIRVEGGINNPHRHHHHHHHRHHHRPFWDCVVITALDQPQCRAFRQQIEDKRNRGELPPDLPVHVVPDPPGVRIGNGGSTLAVVEFLESEYGLDLKVMKIFLVHAGGWSQRIPSAAVLGKIFSLIPYGDPPFQMLDLKLALSWPFVEKVGPGIFLGSGDDFSIHNLGEDLSHISASSRGFTALGHPSPISLGRSHGVYVVEDPDTLDLSQHVVGSRCLEVLQKPDDERMKTHGAVLPGETHIFADGVQMDGEIVYTDSCFFFGTDVIEKLLDLKKSIGKLTCEIDAFGDILQAAGEKSTGDYVYNTSNISVVTDSLVNTRKAVFEALKGTDINLFLLNASAYIHIGTTKELLHYFCRDAEFQSKLNFQKDVFTNWISRADKDNHIGLNKCHLSPEKTVEEDSNRRDNVSKYSCVIHSSLHELSTIGADTFVEVCDFDIPVDIAGNSIISNCQLSGSNIGRVTVPENTFLHTIPIRSTPTCDKENVNDSCSQNISIKSDSNRSITISNRNGSDSSSCTSSIEYVTILMDINDNLKKAVTVNKLGCLPFNQRDINYYLNQRSLTLQDILPEKYHIDIQDHVSHISKGDGVDASIPEIDPHNASTAPGMTADTQTPKTDALDAISLWNLKLFPAYPSMTSSFLDAIDINRGQGSNKEHSDSLKPLVFYSLADLLQVKDVTEMLKYRQALYDKIKQGL